MGRWEDGKAKRCMLLSAQRTLACTIKECARAAFLLLILLLCVVVDFVVVLSQRRKARVMQEQSGANRLVSWVWL